MPENNQNKNQNDQTPAISTKTEETAKATTQTSAGNKTKVVAIPVNPLNKKDDKIKVIINGKETVVKRGVQQAVSEAVYERLVIAGLVVEG